MSEQENPNHALNTMLTRVGHPLVTREQGMQFGIYLDLLMKWNARMNLTAVREPEMILERHFVECICCARALPAGIGSLLDLGSGAGLPGIPIAICRPELAVTLAESQVKKTGFLNEVRRVTGLGFEVFAGRAESIRKSFDCVAMRAVDRMNEAIGVGSQLLNKDGWLALLITRSSVNEAMEAAGPTFRWTEPVKLPGSEQRVLLLGCRAR